MTYRSALPGLSSAMFSDARQQRISKRLAQLIGPGPATYFADACRFMAHPAEFGATANLVAHLAREVESALRAVFLPISDYGKPQDSKEGHVSQIRAVLRSLDIPDSDSDAKKWFEMPGALHDRAPETISRCHDPSMILFCAFGTMCSQL